MRIRENLARFRGQEDFHLNLVGRRRQWFILSGIVLLLALAGLLGRGLNLGIDFGGGAVLQFENRAGASIDEIREALTDVGREEAIVQAVGDGELQVRTETLGEDRTQILTALAETAGLSVVDISVQDVGPKWGAQISAKMLQGLIVFLVVVSVYISFRFEWKMALAAIVALIHDVVITFGIYALVGREVTPEAVIAILTILGYSLYDTVVIFDKVKENAESLALVAKETYAGAVNLSLNQVFMRSINTSLSSLLPIGALLLFGGDTLKNFAFALFIGIAVGAYSSVCVAAPLLVVLKEREPRLAEIRDRAVRRARPALQAVPAGPSMAGEVLEPVTTQRSEVDRQALRQIAPRRQRRKKRRRR